MSYPTGNNPFLPSAYNDLYRAAFGSAPASDHQPSAAYTSGAPVLMPGVVSTTTPAAPRSPAVHPTTAPAPVVELRPLQSEPTMSAMLQPEVIQHAGNLPSLGPGELDILLSPQGTATFSAGQTSGQGQGTAEINIVAAPAPNASAVQITIGSAQEEAGLPPSALSGLSVQQMLDLDADSLAVKIDRQHCMVKKAILDHVMELKARLMQAQAQALEEERRLGAAKMAAKQEELNLALHDLSLSQGRVAKLEEVAWRSSVALDHSKERRRSLLLLAHAFYGWRERAMYAARRRMRMERADRWYVEGHLKRNVFRAWFRTAMQLHRVSLAAKYASDMEAAKALMAEQYGAQITELRRQLADAGSQLEREAEARAKLEENMKRAFMRGVCALNIEAMTIMKRGSLPDGANPFPITIPGAPPSAPPPSAGAAAPSEGLQNQPVAAAASTAAAQPAATAAPAVTSPVSGVQVMRHSATAASPAAVPTGPSVVRAAPSSAAPPAASPAAVDPLGGPVLRDTAANFYTRPAVVVTRGPAGEAPKPRSAVPVPIPAPRYSGHM